MKSSFNQGELKTIKRNTQEQSNQVTQSPSSRRKQKEFFMTKKPINVIEEAKKQLHDYIDVMDDKIEKHIERNEVEFLFAYQNQARKLKNEMEELKNKALSQANSAAGQLKKIQSLEKQVSMFREQSLKIFERLEDKQNEIFLLKKRIEELEQENHYLENNLKTVNKKNMVLEGLKNQEKETKKPQVPFNIGNSLDLRPSLMTANNKKKLRIRDIRLQFKKRYQQATSLDGLTHKIDNLLVQVDGGIKESIKKEVEQFFNFRQTSKAKTIESKDTTIRSKSLQRSQKQVNFSHRSQMQEYLQLCIDTVRKQIIRRKGLKTLNFFKEHSSISFEDFQKMDFFRLMELLVSHEKVSRALYQVIFNE